MAGHRRHRHDNDASDELSFEQNSPVTIGVAGSLQLSVSTGSTYDEDDDVSDDVTWQSLTPGVATVTRTGFVQAVAVGSAQIQVTLDGETETITVNVI